MATLAELQSRFRSAVVKGDLTAVGEHVDERVRNRVAVHRRNYQASLVQAILGKFPAAAWLAGAQFMTEAALSFVEEYPPERPCVAEYGEWFPHYLSMRPGAERMPYLKVFATLEWHIGHLAIAVVEAPVAVDEVSRIDAGALAGCRLSLQNGVRYLRSAWPVDELMRLYLADCAPNQLVFDPQDVFLELRGSRGEFRITRLEEAEFSFRSRLAQGHTISAAAEHALDVEESFDAGAALLRVISEELAVAVRMRDEEEEL